MAIRTGTQLLADMQSVEDQVTVALGAPSRGNVRSIISALTTLEQNGRDSRYSIQVNPVVDYNRGGERPAKDIANLAADLRADLRLADIDGAASARLPAVQKIALSLTTSAWSRYKALPFTT